MNKTPPNTPTGYLHKPSHPNNSAGSTVSAPNNDADASVQNRVFNTSPSDKQPVAKPLEERNMQSAILDNFIRFLIQNATPEDKERLRAALGSILAPQTVPAVPATKPPEANNASKEACFYSELKGNLASGASGLKKTEITPKDSGTEQKKNPLFASMEGKGFRAMLNPVNKERQASPKALKRAASEKENDLQSQLLSSLERRGFTQFLKPVNKKDDMPEEKKIGNAFIAKALQQQGDASDANKISLEDVVNNFRAKVRTQYSSDSDNEVSSDDDGSIDANWSVLDEKQEIRNLNEGFQQDPEEGSFEKPVVSGLKTVPNYGVLNGDGTGILTSKSGDYTQAFKKMQEWQKDFSGKRITPS